MRRAFLIFIVALSVSLLGVEASPASASTSASLAVKITMLPGNVPANVTVTGPGNFVRHIVTSTTFDGLAAGTYAITAVPTRHGALRYFPVAPSSRVVLAPGGQGSVTVSYANIVPDTTKVPVASTVTGLSSNPVGQATLTLSSLPGGLAVGDVLAIGVTAATPDGFLGKVTAFSQTATGYSVSTVPATLEEAMPDGVIDPSWTEPAQNEPVGDRGVSCGAGASLSVTGNLNLTPGGDFAAQWGAQGVTSASFDGSLTVTQQLKAVVDGAASCKIDDQPLLASPIKFGRIPVDIGIPIVLTPELQFNLSADATTNASLTEDATMTATATAGLAYANGQLTPVSQFTTSFTPQAPAPDLQASLSASVGPTLSVLIDDFAGPEVNIDGSLGLDVTPLGSPAWTLTGGLNAGGGLTSPILHLDESNPSIISYSTDLDTSPPVIQTMSLPHGTAGTAFSQTLSASSGTPPYQWSVSSGGLPPGLSLDATTGTISGTPTQPGSYSFTVQALDSSTAQLSPNGQSATAQETITVSSGSGGGGEGTTTEFSVPTSNSQPLDITTGPDGNLWFTENTGNKIGRITPSGTITEFAVPTSNSQPYGITSGPDGNLWFTEPIENTGPNKIGRITPSGSITEFTVPTTFADPIYITAGPDGNLWFTELTGNKIGRISPSGTFTEYAIPTSNSFPVDITTGPDGNLWFTENTGNKIGRITPSGTITEYAVPTANAGPLGITAGPDGNLWFTEAASSKIGEITPSGTITEFTVPTGNSQPEKITTGPDGNLWFTEALSDKIGRITISGIFTEYALPSGSAPVGITAGPDGNVWFADSGNNIGRIVP